MSNEKPIHMSADEYQALVSGRKTKKPKMRENRRDGLNKTEQEYLMRLRLTRPEAAILGHESLKFQVGHTRCWYTPDFPVVAEDGRLELHEVKGPFVRDDARVKFQAAALLYRQFHWVWAQRTKAGWEETVVPAEGE